jgi:hypothetical protein
MDRLIRLPGVLARNMKDHRFGIAHMAFNIPEAVFSLKALVIDASGVRKCARLCR